MTDLEAFAAILELARKHKIPVPDGWDTSPRGHWFRHVAEGEPNVLAADPTDLDLQAMTGVLGAWLEEEHGVTIVAWGGPVRYVLGTVEHGDDFSLTLRGMQINYIPHNEYCTDPDEYPTRLQAQLAALRHVTEEKP